MDLRLPEKTVEVHQVKMFANERANYELILKSTGLLLQGLQLSSGDAAVLSQFSNILECLLRMRQCCCCDGLVPTARLQAAREVLAALEQRRADSVDGTIRLSAEEAKALFLRLKGALDAGDEECAICMSGGMDENSLRILRKCQHRFCGSCIGEMFDKSAAAADGSLACPLCRTPFTRRDVISLGAAATAAEGAEGGATAAEEASAAIATHVQVPAKVAALLADFHVQREIDRDVKCVIFSTFTSYLDIVAAYLEKEYTTFVRLDGRMTRAEKDAALAEFDVPVADGGPAAFLISTKAGGQGLNLVQASRVYIMDVWWNAGVEEQAMDRVHRIGQTKRVRVVRLVSEDSIECIINELQESKKQLGRGAMQKLSSEELQKMKMGDLRKLFRDYL